MPEEFAYDVFLSHSAKDKAVVRPLAERLRQDGLKVWFDEWEIKRRDSIPAKIEEGLEHSRVLVLCMSAQAFGSDWAQLEAGTFRFRDPLNQDRRFIPLRLDDSLVKGSLAQSLYINWHSKAREMEYEKLLEACQPQAKPTSAKQAHLLALDRVCRGHAGKVFDVSVTPDGRTAASCSEDGEVRIWDVAEGICRQCCVGHKASVFAVAITHDGSKVISGGKDRTIRIWNAATGDCLGVSEDQLAGVVRLAVTETGLAVCALSDGTLGIWDLIEQNCVGVLSGHTRGVWGVAVTPDGRLAISGSADRTVRVWSLDRKMSILLLRGHEDEVNKVAISPDGRRAMSASYDCTVRIWDLERAMCVGVLEGHTSAVQGVAITNDGLTGYSCSNDGTVMVWDIETGTQLQVLRQHNRPVEAVRIVRDGTVLIAGSWDGTVSVWSIPEKGSEWQVNSSRLRYTNAKVLLVGESGVGKTGLSKRLASDVWEPSDSTVGAWATQWKLPVSSGKGVEREIWLWDFGGQADQRLIHQLYMDETALAVLVFDGQKEDLFETLGQWDRDLTRASRKEFAKLLVAGRVDAGGLRASRSEVEKFAADRNFRCFLETSAKRNLGCEELKQAILTGINWDEIPCRTTEVLFKRLKEEIIRLKDEGRVLMRFNELRETLQLRLSETRSVSEGALADASGYNLNRFTDEQLKAVLTLLAGPGVVWELAFGSWVLLQPERINAYAQAVIRTLQADEHQRGCLMEERVLKGDLAYESSMPRLAGDEERFVLLAMHQTLVERGLCLRQPTDKGNLLVFPSYYRRERPEQVKFPAVLSSYQFTGFLDEIYATLVVRLHHTAPFQQEQLWRYAADFRTNTGKLLGIKLTRQAPGVGELEVYFDPAVVMEEKIIFCRYVHEHLLQHARDVERLRHYVCQCGTPVGNREVARQRLNDWLQGPPPQPEAGSWFKFRKGQDKPPTIICVSCEQRVPLWDEMEQCFASPEIQQRVREMQEASAIVLSNQSKERALVGDVISTVALADQISREFNVSDQGIDMEIEFTDDAHEATGAKLYLQLKSGDSYLRERKSDGAEIFTIKDERHARYWMAQAFPVLLVIRNSEGEVRWMEVRDWLKRASDNGRKPVKQIIFEGERFDVMSIRRWREKVLAAGWAR